MTTPMRSIGALAGLATALAVHGQTRLVHVDASAPPGGDGASWSTAFRDLQDGLDHARTLAAGFSFRSPDRVEVLVGPGVYRPDRGTGDRDASFIISERISLLGGFAGRTAPDPYARPPITDAYLSTLCGDLLGNDAPNFANRADNSRTVVRIDIPQSAVSEWFWGWSYIFGNVQLGGFAIRGGEADGPSPSGAGLVVQGLDWETATIAACRFIDNRAVGSGGAALVQRASFRDCSFINNRAQSGGAVSVLSSAGFFDCRLSGNHATLDGGAIRAAFVSVRSTTIASNTALRDGGGVHARSMAGWYSTLAGNSASRGGGAFISDGAVAGSGLSNSLIAHNLASIEGGGLHGHVGLSFCTVVGNRAATGGGLWSAGTTAVSSIFWNNAASVAGPLAAGPGPVNPSVSLVQGATPLADIAVPGVTLGPSVLAADPLFVDPAGTSADPLAWADKNYRLRPESPGVDAGTTPTPDYELSDLTGGARAFNASSIAVARADIGAYETTTQRAVIERPVIFVRAGAPAGGDGRTWATAFRDIPEALATPGVNRVFIAQGVYRVDAGTHARDAMLRITKPGVELHGSFLGVETTADQRPAGPPTTVITGDINGDDGPSPLSRADNSAALLEVRLPLFPLTSPAFSMSGLHFRAARGVTSATHIVAPVVRIDDCRWTDHAPLTPSGILTNVRLGGAATVVAADTRIRRARFEANTGDRGPGGLALSRASGSGNTAALEDCEFVANTSLNGFGGGLGVEWSVIARLERCVFVANASISASHAAGGAVAVEADAGLTVRSSKFIGNFALATGLPSPWGSPLALGGAIAAARGYTERPFEIVGSLLASNLAVGARASGGAVHAGPVAPRLINCTLVDNASGPSLGSLTGPQVFGTLVAPDPADPAAPSSLIANCIFASPSFPGVTAIDLGSAAPGRLIRTLIADLPGPIPSGVVSATDPRFVSRAGRDGVLGTIDDDYRLAPGSPAIDAGDLSLLPADARTLDLGAQPRLIDDPAAPGAGPLALDLGAHEYRCPADFDADGQAGIDDIFTFLSAWFDASPRADTDADGAIRVDDVFVFLAAWFAGC